MPAPGNIDEFLRLLFEEVDAELTALGASCAACGRCCRFAEFGHQLWLTSAELDFLVARHPVPDAVAPGACPYLDGSRCAARAGRSLACRTFHCALADEVVEELTNRYLERLRAAAREAGLALEYAELSELLGSHRPSSE